MMMNIENDEDIDDNDEKADNLSIYEHLDFGCVWSMTLNIGTQLRPVIDVRKGAVNQNHISSEYWIYHADRLEVILVPITHPIPVREMEKWMIMEDNEKRDKERNKD